MADEEKPALSDEIIAALQGTTTTLRCAKIPISESMTMRAKATSENESAVNCSYKDENKDAQWRFVKMLRKDDEVTEQVYRGDEVYVLYVEVTLEKAV
jgi:hypothetical protein